MANYSFKLPDVGEGIVQAEIVAWHVKIGDAVKQDDPLVDVMTDKATVEIGAPVGGKIVQRKGEAGQMFKVGDELVVIDTGTAAAPSARAPKAAASGAAVAAAETIAPNAALPVRAPAVTPSGEQPAQRKVLASPAVRSRAGKLGIDLGSIRGTGEGGRVEHSDLDAVLTAPRASTGARTAPRRPEAVEEIQVIGLRRQIANAMQESKRRIPHFAYVEEVDVTEVEALRAELNARYGETRPRLTILPFIVKAMVRAVATHPGVNAHYDDQAAVIRRYAAVNMGVATQTPRGLVVPVVRNAETLDLWGLAAEMDRLATAARAGKATREELSGSTITVSSLGRLGGVAATPIIKPPEVAIVGVNKIAERPVVRGDRIIVRKMMNLSSSFDHRVVDGFDGADFIQTLRGYLESPAQMFME